LDEVEVNITTYPLMKTTPASFKWKLDELNNFCYECVDDNNPCFI